MLRPQTRINEPSPSSGLDHAHSESDDVCSIDEIETGCDVGHEECRTDTLSDALLKYAAELNEDRIDPGWCGRVTIFTRRTLQKGIEE